MVFDKLIWRYVVGRNGRAKAGLYPILQPAEAGAGRYRRPAYKLPGEKVKHHQLVRRGTNENSAKIKIAVLWL
ncbi:MAG TPA: hypothetical protein VHV10_09325 [Ktedonobacteraceae bacterium]|jgi:hypothetical protein|nr:hypothetical protein [Ktedonobacteraceae bacterium]